MRKSLSLASVLVFLIAAALQAQDKAAAEKMAAQQKAAMDVMMRAATPGDAHKKLNAMLGTFDVKVKFWPAPGTPATESAGKAVYDWVLGGRWLQQRFEGSFMGQPFSGIGYVGYDNVRKMYIGTWMDTMSTSVMSSTGTADAGGKNWMFTASTIDPMTGEPSNAEEKVTVIDNDHHVFELYGPGPDGSNYKTMEITYTRKK